MGYDRTSAILVSLTQQQAKSLAAGQAIRLVIRTKTLEDRKSRRRRDVLSSTTFNNDLAGRLSNAWNNSNIVREAQANGESRNQPIDDLRLGDKRLRMNRDIEYVGPQKVAEELDAYFTACTEGDHRPAPGRCIAFVCLDRFLAKLVDLKKKGKKPWWHQKHLVKRVEDEFPTHTVAIADEFACRFLNRKRWGKLVNPSTAYQKFAAAASRVRPIGDEIGTADVRLERVMFDAVAEQAGGDTVYPGNLASDHLWQVVIPQRLKRIL